MGYVGLDKTLVVPCITANPTVRVPYIICLIEPYTCSALLRLIHPECPRDPDITPSGHTSPGRIPAVKIPLSESCYRIKCHLGHSVDQSLVLQNAFRTFLCLRGGI